MSYYYHGTTAKNWDTIRIDGLKSGFLASDRMLACKYAGTDGIILKIDATAAEMKSYSRGIHFFDDGESPRIICGVREITDTIFSIDVQISRF